MTLVLRGSPFGSIRGQPIQSKRKMQNVAPVINQVSRGGTLQLAFSSAVVSLVATFAAAAGPPRSRASDCLFWAVCCC